MARKTDTITIDNVQYRITQLGADTGGQVMFRLGRAFGGIALGLRVGNVSVASLEPAEFSYLVDTLRPTTMVGIVDTAGDKRTTWVSLEQVYDDHFAGRYAQMLAWLKASLEVNFGPLVDAFAALFRAAEVAKGSGSKPPTESTGSAGDSSSAHA